MKYLYLNVNSADPDQTPRFVASDLGLHCLPMSLLWDARLKLVNITDHSSVTVKHNDSSCMPNIAQSTMANHVVLALALQNAASDLGLHALPPNSTETLFISILI